MRRLKILFFWLFINKNNISIKELLKFLFKPVNRSIAKRYIENITYSQTYEVSFTTIPYKLYWPQKFPINRLYQIISETFDKSDWHYYQKEKTIVNQGEILLDIGTADGLFPLAVVDNCEHIFMVEPSPTFNKCLTKTFEAFSDKITIFPVAVGNFDGQIPFDENSLDGKVSKTGGNETSIVKINKIDTLLQNKKITYLKADIEGFEMEMLRGAEQTIKSNKPKIAITTYHAENDPKEIVSLIKQFVPEYKYYVKGIYELTPKPILIHFWI